MAPKKRQQQFVDQGNSSQSKKKQRTGMDSGRRSDRVGKGTGGAVDQLRKVGDAVGRAQKTRDTNHAAAAGEARNPMAPYTPSRVRTKQRLDVDRRQDALLPGSSTRLDGRFGLRVDESPPRPNTLANGLQIIAAARATYVAKRSNTAPQHNPGAIGTDEDCLPGDAQDDDGDSIVIPRTDQFSGQDQEDSDPPQSDGNRSEESDDSQRDQPYHRDSDEDMLPIPGSDRDEAVRDAEEQQGQDLQDNDVLEDHYTRNRRPRPPSPSSLAAVRQQARKDPNLNNASENNDNSTSDDEPRSRRGRFSQTPKKDHCKDPTQLAFYPPKWKDFIDECKVETRTHVAINEPWPQRRAALSGFITDAINMTVQKWRRENRTVEKGYYPQYKSAMGILLFEDIASWRGEIKKAANTVVRAQYNIFPPRGTNLSSAASRRHVKSAADELIKRCSFAHGGKDEEGHTNNFGHPAIRELIHMFLFSRDNRIGHLRPTEFGRCIPTATLCLAVTAIRCILDGYKTHGKPKFPQFSGDLYRAKWLKYCNLVNELRDNELHGRKFDDMCSEIASNGIIGHGHTDLDDGVSSDDDYGVIFD